MDEILTSTSAELFPDESTTDLAWLNTAMSQNSDSNLVSSSSHSGMIPWKIVGEVDDENADFFSEDSSEDSCIKRPRKFFKKF